MRKNFFLENIIFPQTNVFNTNFESALSEGIQTRWGKESCWWKAEQLLLEKQRTFKSQIF